MIGITMTLLYVEPHDCFSTEAVSTFKIWPLPKNGWKSHNEAQDKNGKQ